jgi:aspartyl/asparaginyl-tRNA synthetase
MMTPSVSSPMGPGSDSQTIPITFGNLHTYLVDSSQFGFEPLIMNGMDRVYCYLPSMRGEDPDTRHLNQFFHCEAEIKGGLDVLIPIIEGYIKSLCQTVSWMPNIVERISKKPEVTIEMLDRIASLDSFKRISFDDAIEILGKTGIEGLFSETPKGRDMSSLGEMELMRILGMDAPLWVTHYDRDRVAFYQKPDPNNPNKVINADLLFPPLAEGSFGGEIVGCGQRQDSAEEMYKSLVRQGIESIPYEWYITLRRQPSYATTSGFGLGVERFITWILCRDDIKDAIIYPRLKNVVTYP